MSDSRLCENSVHASRASARTGCRVRKIKHSTVRPELSRRAPAEFSHSLAKWEKVAGDSDSNASVSIDILALVRLELRQLLIIVLICALFVFSRSVDAQPARISYGGTSGFNVPIWVTYDAGLFKKYGLNAELILVSGDAPSMQAMLANEIQFYNGTGASAISAVLQGAAPVIVATSYDLMPYGVVVHKDIGSPADLKGKRIAISRFGGVTEFAAKVALEKFGLNTKEVTLI